ncbi:MAG: hypothetical protein J6X25_09125 [Bacteroidales bacterium]|nr:hypothetical protein [Bacteroidales bacterium]
MKNNKWYKWEVLLLLWVAYMLNQGDRQVFNSVLWTYVAAFVGVLLAGTLSDIWAAKTPQKRMVIQGAEPLLPGIELLVVDDYGNATLKGLQASFEK